MDLQSGRQTAPLARSSRLARKPLGSLSGQAYAIRDHDLSPLCPDATRDTQVCGEAVALAIDSNSITALQWLDRDRFLVAGIEPNILALGRLDGTFVPVVTWEDYESVTGAQGHHIEGGEVT